MSKYATKTYLKNAVGVADTSGFAKKIDQANLKDQRYWK